EGLELRGPRVLGLHDVEPAEPLGLVATGPQRRVAACQPCGAAALVPGGAELAEAFAQRLGKTPGEVRIVGHVGSPTFGGVYVSPCGRKGQRGARRPGPTSQARGRCVVALRGNVVGRL